MEIEKRTWLLEQYIQKTWTLSMMLAQEAARAGQNGKGYAVVAGETRNLTEKLQTCVSAFRFDGNQEEAIRGIADCAFQLKLLSTNSMLEITRVMEYSMDYNIPKSMAVYTHELSIIGDALNELSGKKAWQKSYTIPEIKNRGGSGLGGRFLSFSVGGHQLVQNLKNIREIAVRKKSEAEEKVFSLRGADFPVIDCYQRFGLTPASLYDNEFQPVLIICPEGTGRECNNSALYAVPIDDLDIKAIFYTQVGLSVPPRKEHAFADCTLECWDTVDGGQMVFADWHKLA